MADPVTIGAITAGASFIDWLMGKSSIKGAADKQYAALDKAQGVIEKGAGESKALYAPYLQNAGQDYAQMRGLVQSGFFQQPYGKSFTSQSYAPQGFSFNPGQGGASFAPWKPQGGLATFNAQPLPTMPQFAPPTPVPGPQTQPQTQAPRPNLNAIPPQVMEVIQQRSTAQTPALQRPAMIPGQTTPRDHMNQWKQFQNTPLGLDEMISRGLVRLPGRGGDIWGPSRTGLTGGMR